MVHPALHTTPATPSRISRTRVASRPYVVVAVLFFFVTSVLSFLVFAPTAVADEQAPEAPGSIAGVVKTADGRPQANMQVFLFQPSPSNVAYWFISRSVTTGADGHYRFTLLPPGIYRIGVRDSKKNFAPLYYPTAPTVERGTDIPVAGNQRSGIDFVLQPGGQIMGAVTATDRITMTGSNVELRQAVEGHGVLYWETVDLAISLPTTGGLYRFTGLSPNLYRICAYGFSMTQSIYECYDNVYELNQATSLTLTMGATISNVNIVLGDGANFAQISGRVTTLDQEPLAAIQVTAVRVPHEGPPIARTKSTLTPSLLTSSVLLNAISAPVDEYGSWWTNSDNQGNYRLTTLPAGRYYLYFSDPAGNYTAQYYDNALFTESADVIELAPKQVISDVNVQLGSGNHIRGSVTLFDQAAAGGTVTAELKTPFGWRYAMSS